MRKKISLIYHLLKTYCFLYFRYKNKENSAVKIDLYIFLHIFAGKTSFHE